MRELSVAEQRYRAVLAVIADGKSVTGVAAEWRVSRQTVHTWLARYEAGGLEDSADRSHRPAMCPHQMPVEVEAMVLEMRRWKPYWGLAVGAGAAATRGADGPVRIGGVPVPVSVPQRSRRHSRFESCLPSQRF
jgi:leucine-zipper of insertion element IS481